MNAQELRKLRLSLDLTQQQMGMELGISRTAIAKIESGENNMSKPVAMLANAIFAGKA